MARGTQRKRSAFNRPVGWEKPAPSRPQVNREQLVREALGLLDAEGFDGLTMRGLATRLKVKAASLYNHVHDKDELLTLLADVLSGEVPQLDASKPWRPQLEVTARDFRRVLLAHRDAARVLAATPPIGPMRLRIIEQVLEVLCRAGFTPADATDAAFVFNSYVVGYVLDETQGRPFEEAARAKLRDEGKRWFKSLPREQYPRLVSLADQLIDGPPERRFQFGLRAMLDGFERRLAAKQR